MRTHKISQEQIDYTKELVSRVNFGNRGRFDGSKKNQFIGILGEVVLADILEKKRPDGEGGFDGGVDFIINNMKFDLKTMARTVSSRPHFVNNLVASQAAYNNDGYIFASINTKTREFELLGIIGKDNLKPFFIAKGTERKRDDGTILTVGADMYEIPNSELKEIK
jgi:hypothetical protein